MYKRENKWEKRFRMRKMEIEELGEMMREKQKRENECDGERMKERGRERETV